MEIIYEVAIHLRYAAEFSIKSFQKEKYNWIKFELREISHENWGLLWQLVQFFVRIQ